MIQATRKITFCSAHRLLKHESACANLHGHNYTALISVRSKDNKLDQVGRVIDFSCVKWIVKEWIDNNWDHATIVNLNDNMLHSFLISNDQRHYTMTVNPTAENMVKELAEVMDTVLFVGRDIVCSKIVLFETENCSVEWNEGDGYVKG